MPVRLLFDFRNQMIDHTRPFAFRNHIEGEGQDGGGLRAIIEIALFLVVLGLVEGCLELVCEVAVAGRVFGFVHQSREAFHDLKTFVEIGRCQDRGRGLAGGVVDIVLPTKHLRRTPVAVVVAAAQPVLDVSCHVVGPFGHTWVITGYQGRIVILVQQVQGREEEGARPGDGVGVSAAGRHFRDAALAILAIFHVSHPLLVERGHIEQEHFSSAFDGTVAEPSQTLVPLRAVRGDAAVVPPHAPDDILINLVDQRIGTGELPGGGDIVVDNPPLQGIQLRLSRKARHLDIAEAVER
jgi:hypothetical protein